MKNKFNIKNIISKITDSMYKFIPVSLLGKDEEFKVILERTYGKKDYSEEIKKERKRNLSFYLIIVLFLIFAFVSSLFSNEIKTTINRNEDNNISVKARINNKEEQINFNVKERKLTNEEINNRLNYTIKTFTKKILGKNKSFKTVKENLNFADKDKNTNVDINYSFEGNAEEYINENGEINFIKLSRKKIVEISVRFEIENIYKIKKYKVILVPKSKDEFSPEEIKTALNEKISEINDDNNNNSFRLPNNILGFNIKYIKDNTFIEILFIFLMFTTLIVFFNRKKHLIKTSNEYKEHLELSYPNYLTKLIMLLEPGFPLEKAIGIIAKDTKEDASEIRNTFQYEMKLVNEKTLKSNESLKTNLNNLALRSDSRNIMRFSSIISDYIEKGIPIINKLEDELNEILDTRKKIVIEKTEKAETKLIMPMCLLLLSILLISIGPVFIEM